MASSQSVRTRYAILTNNALNILSGGSITVQSGGVADFKSGSTVSLPAPLNIGGAAMTATAAQLNYVGGVTSGLQAQLDAKVNTVPYFVHAFVGNPVLSTTMYFGQLPQIPSATAAINKAYIRKAGTIKTANIYSYSVTAGTGEAWIIYVRLNNTTDTAIATVSAATNERVWSNTSLSIAVVSGDYIEIKSVNPAWSVSPLNTTFGGYIHVE